MDALYRRFIEGQRIYLREVRQSDVNEDYYRWMNDSEIIQYTESRFRPNSTDQIKAFVSAMEQSPDNIFLAIIDRASDRHVGNIKLGGINWKHRLADIGLIIGDKSSWGKGYATEAISLTADFAGRELGLHKVWAGCYANNGASIRAFEKAGFVQEALLHEHHYYQGSYIDVVLLGKVLA